MNRKGFTLIELLAIIVLIGIVGVITVPNVLDAVGASRNASYKMLIKNIVTAAENYYMECEYGDLSDSSVYGDYACSISDNTIEVKLGDLAATGLLKTNETKKENGKIIKKVTNPNTNEDITECEIKITKNNSVYAVESDGNPNCPSTEDYEEE